MTKANHVGIIMDGDRCWAKHKGLPSIEGHMYAAKNAIEPLIEECVKQKIPYVTFWAFSTENWKRDREEVEDILKVFRFALANLSARFIKRGARMHILGDLSRFPKDIAQSTLKMLNLSKKNSQVDVTFALNYGGRDEILRAVKKIVKDKIPAENLTEELFGSYLDTAGTPDPDLIIRTGGEQRLSGYLPWQAVYAELYFTNVLFPDFNPKELDKALDEFSKRDRRFGGNSKQPSH